MPFWLLPSRQAALSTGSLWSYLLCCARLPFWILWLVLSTEQSHSSHVQIEILSALAELLHIKTASKLAALMHCQRARVMQDLSSDHKCKVWTPRDLSGPDTCC